jgi:hypothetical protein
MPDWLSQGAPIGLIMFLATVLAFARRKAGRVRAQRALPKLAEQLGLSFVAPRYAGMLGSLNGTFRGYAVRVDPDEQRRISVRFAHAPPVDLRSYTREHHRAPFGMADVYSGDRVFDRFFKTRFAADPIADQLRALERPSRLLEPFLGRYSRHVQSLSVTSSGVTCVLDFGSPPFIPEEAIRALLPACTALAEMIEPTQRPDAARSEQPNGEVP